MIWLACLLSLAASLGLYLTSPNQRLLAGRLMPAIRWVAWLSWLIALISAVEVLGTPAGSAFSLATLLLGCVTWPYLAFIRQRVGGAR